jgi:hypothetical protein
MDSNLSDNSIFPLNDHFRIAYFITPHGFGHASRAAAVMNAINVLNPLTHFEIFTQVPEWFFETSLNGNFTYHSLFSDIGLIQNSPLQEDLSSTLNYLEAFLPFDQSQLQNLARFIKEERQCSLVFCDIAPLGIAVAKMANLPSFLIENFTWDWIYQGYIGHEARFSKFIPILNDYFSMTDHHIQVEPVCRKATDVELTAQPVSRKQRSPRDKIRSELDIPQSASVVLITMGGIQGEFDYIEKLTKVPEIIFIIPGSSQYMEKQDNLVMLPHHSKFFHPDLLNASDAVVGKVGYSTVAEVYHAGIPFGCIPRPQFRESDVLISYIMQNNPCIKISSEDFASGEWINQLPELLAIGRVKRTGPNGADQVASLVNQFIPTNQESSA